MAFELLTQFALFGTDLNIDIYTARFCRYVLNFIAVCQDFKTLFDPNQTKAIGWL